MTPKLPDLPSVSTAVTKALEAQVREAVKQAGGEKVSEVLSLSQTERHERKNVLFMLLNTPLYQRSAGIAKIIANLAKELPAVLAKGPLRPSHFGFKNLQDMITFVASQLVTMNTIMTTKGWFTRGLLDWERGFMGKVLFERLVKHHQALDTLFRRLAGDLFNPLNHAIKAAAEGAAVAGKNSAGIRMWNGRGTAVRVTKPFAPPVQKAVAFKLKGPDGVVRDYTDFGMLAKNADGQWAMMPIEIKLWSALKDAPKQIAEFLPRLKQAQEVIAVILNPDGSTHELRISPDKLVFAHDKAQLVMAPETKTRVEETYKTPISPDQVANLERLEPSASNRYTQVDPVTKDTHGLTFYRGRILLRREWLQDIIEIITGKARRH